MKKLMISLLLLSGTIQADFVFHIGWHGSTASTALGLAHKAASNDKSFSLHWSQDQCIENLITAGVIVGAVVVAYYALDYATRKETK